MARFFANDPVIQFTRVACPFCKQPTGTDSKCENLEGSDEIILTPAGTPLELYSTSCYYKRNIRYIVEVNYPVSELLLQRLQGVAGLNGIYARQVYSFTIDIVPLFDESAVKRTISTVFKTYIKELQADELSLLDNAKPVVKKVKITMPNGQSSILSLDSPIQQSILQEIKDFIPNAKIEEAS